MRKGRYKMATNSDTKKVTKTVEKTTKATVESTYTVDEFVKAAKKLEASPDIVRAAFKCANKETATLEEAKKLVKSFKTKEVK